MRTRLFLPNPRHRPMIRTVVSPLSTRLIPMILVTGQFFVRLKLFSNWNCQLDWNSNSVFYGNPLLQKHCFKKSLSASPASIACSFETFQHEQCKLLTNEKN